MLCSFKDEGEKFNQRILLVTVMNQGEMVNISVVLGADLVRKEHDVADFGSKMGRTSLCHHGGLANT